MSIQEKLHQFKSKIENGYYYEEKTKQKNLKSYQEVEDYILGNSTKIPTIAIKDYYDHTLNQKIYLNYIGKMVKNSQKKKYVLSYTGKAEKKQCVLTLN
jgi:hypothetical protein